MTKLTDEQLEERFASFDFEASLHLQRDPIRALHWAAQFRDYLDMQMSELVVEARSAGATWTQIGDALGVTHQAAMKRFKKSA